MLFRGTIATEYSGKIDGLVAAQNRGTEYFRTLGPTPVPPGGYSDRQLNVQESIAWANTVWQGAPQADRDAWQAWALAQLRGDRVAARHTRTGWNEFVRWAAPRRYARDQLGISLDTPTTAPSGAQVPLETPPVIVPHADSDVCEVSFNPANTWAHDDEGGLLVFVSRPISPTRNRAYGGFQLVDLIPGSSTSPPSSPWTLAAAPTTPAGYKLFARFRATSHTRGMSFDTRSVATAL